MSDFIDCQSKMEGIFNRRSVSGRDNGIQKIPDTDAIGLFTIQYG